MSGSRGAQADSCQSSVPLQDLAWTLDPEIFGILLYSYCGYLSVNP